MTPLKVRGRRHGPNAGQWHAGKKRPPSSPISTSREGSPASQHSAAHAQKRRRHKRVAKLSKLEELPSEVLQTIFEYSTNLDLPAASPSLREQLSSRHMFRRLTDRILIPCLEHGAPRNQSKSHLAVDHIVEEPVWEFRIDATVPPRLLNSKFMTWDFFHEWSKETETVYASRLDLDLREGAHVRHMLGLWLNTPEKVFRSPWDAGDGYKKLYFLAMSDRQDRVCTPQFEESRRAALRCAVTLDDTRAATAFLRHSHSRDPPWDIDMADILRYAVIDCGCNKQIVSEIFSMCKNFPLLDPQLWAWGTEKRMAGDDKGPWLLRMLKQPPSWFGEGRYRTDIHKFAYDWTPTTLDEGGKSSGETEVDSEDDV